LAFFFFFFLALFFSPGISSTLCKVILKDPKENHQLLVESIYLLRQVICQSLNDNINSEFLPQTSTTLEDLALLYTKNKNKKKENESEENSLSVNVNTQINEKKNKVGLIERDENWLKKANERIFSLLRQLTTIREHRSHKVRLAFVNLYYGILIECSRTMKLSVPFLIETVVFYSRDPSIEVKTASQDALKDLYSRFENVGDDFISILQDNLRSLLISLPRKVTGNDEKIKYESISQIVAYISILGESSSILLENCINSVSLGLLTVLTLEVKSLGLVEDRLIALVRSDVDRQRLIEEPINQEQTDKFPEKR